MPGKIEEVFVPVCGHRAAINHFPCKDRTPQWCVLALHGFTGSGADFSGLAELLSDLPVEWLCPDFMGHGNSDSPANVDPYRLLPTLQLIDRTRQLATRGTRVLLLAYSMGGRLALHYLKWADPLPAVLVGTSPGIEDKEERAERRDRDHQLIEAASGDIGKFCDTWEQQDLIKPQTLLPEPLRTHIALRRRSNSVEALGNSLAGSGTGALPGLWNDLEDLPEMLLLHGEDDRKFTDINQRMQATNSRIKAQAIAKSGHAPHLENPEAVARVLKIQMGFR